MLKSNYCEMLFMGRIFLCNRQDENSTSKIIFQKNFYSSETIKRVQSFRTERKTKTSNFQHKIGEDEANGIKGCYIIKGV